MIAFVRGTVSEIGEGYVVVETPSGVGYLVKISPESALWDNLAVSSPVSLYTSHQIRENGQDLYGFGSLEERNFFEQLLIVSGVGPRIASSLVAVLGQKQLAQMILSEDIEGIDAVPGIGRKLAERIIVYLRDKALGVDKGEASAKPRKRIEKKPELSVVVQALERLGFNPRERDRMISELKESDFEGKEVEDILKQLLAQQSAR